ncbi:acyl carrier protein [Brevibacillus ginsengisoli]|uniref:acyl carrier protein n=1 Tax=Brevibacillus ginsengisoli TaxID=363854 RepID=UPI003CF41182
MSAILRKIFADTLDLPEEQIIDSLEYNSIPNWDSVAHMALIAALDDTFNIMIDTEDVIDFNSFKKVKEVLMNKYGVAL